MLDKHTRMGPLLPLEKFCLPPYTLQGSDRSHLSGKSFLFEGYENFEVEYHILKANAVKFSEFSIGDLCLMKLNVVASTALSSQVNAVK